LHLNAGWDPLPLHLQRKPAPFAREVRVDPLPTTVSRPKAPTVSSKTLPKPKPAAPQPPSSPPILPPTANTLPKTQRQTVAANHQLNLLLERQQKFKEAALEAKRNGSVEKAKEYLRQARGFDPLIDGVRSGLPIDFKSIPEPPKGVSKQQTVTYNAHDVNLLRIKNRELQQSLAARDAEYADLKTRYEKLIVAYGTLKKQIQATEV